MLYVLEKIVEENAENRRYGSIWNQMFIRETDTSKEAFEWCFGLSSERPKSIRCNLKDGIVINLSGGVFFQEEDESESHFMIRSAIAGKYPDYIAEYKRNSDWSNELIGIVRLSDNKHFDIRNKK